MAAKKDFVKERDADFDEQEENFITKLPAHAATLGIEPAEVADTVNIITAHRTSFTDSISAKASAKAAVALNHQRKKAAVDEFRRMAKKIKSSLNYTEEIGDDLGIIGPEIVMPDQSEMKPTLKAKLSGQNVIIDFEKQRMEGVKIYSRRGLEAGFSYLATDTYSPYTDSRPKLAENSPEERQYYAFYFSDDYDIGQQSDIITIVIP